MLQQVELLGRVLVNATRGGHFVVLVLLIRGGFVFNNDRVKSRQISLL